MSDFPGSDGEAAAIHAEFALPVIYAGAGLAQPTEITAIKTDEPADAFQGNGSSARRISFEVRKSAVPGVPGKSDRITEGAQVWCVIDRADRSDIGAWILTVERA